MKRIILLFLLATSNLALAYRPQPPDDYDGPSVTDDIPPWLFLIIFVAVPAFFWWGKKKNEEFDVQGCGCMFILIITVVGFICMFFKGCS